MKNHLFVIVTLMVVWGGTGSVLSGDGQDGKSFSGNPIIKHDRSADPSVVVGEDGTIWMFCSHDQDDATSYRTMDGYRAFSSKNLVDWVDRGEIPHSRDLSWGGRSGFMFAPDAVSRKRQYGGTAEEPRVIDYGGTGHFVKGQDRKGKNNCGLLSCATPPKQACPSSPSAKCASGSLSSGCVITN